MSLKTYILRWGVNASHLTESAIVHGYRNACNEYAKQYEEAVDGDYPCVALVLLKFDATGHVNERVVKMSRSLTVEQVQAIQEGTL